MLIESYSHNCCKSKSKIVAPSKQNANNSINTKNVRQKLCVDCKACVAGSEGSCSDGSCSDGSCSEGSCSEGSCSEGSCSEGSCSEGSCGRTLFLFFFATCFTINIFFCPFFLSSLWISFILSFQPTSRKLRKINTNRDSRLHYERLPGLLYWKIELKTSGHVNKV